MSLNVSAIGLDIGGTNLKACAFGVDERILAETTAPTGDDGTTAWQRNAAHVVREIAAKLTPTAGLRLGIAAPGLAASDGRSIAFMPGRLSGLAGLDWKTYLSWPGDVLVLNDAHAALLGEFWQGAARGAANAILITLGTGVGGAVLADGRLLRGSRSRAGLLGHVSLNPAGIPDIVGMPGSLEDEIGECTVNARSGGRFKTNREMVEAARAGDPHATELWDTAVRSLGVAIAGFVNMFDPEVVVIGGGLADADEMLFAPLRAYLDKFEWRPDLTGVRVVKAQLGSRAGAIGAAFHAMHPTL